MSRGDPAREIELKLLLPGKEVEQQVVSCLRERGYRIEEADPVRNWDVYLDTFDWSLLRHQLSLRYRVADERAVYTLKSLGGIAEGIANRTEMEVPLDGPAALPAKLPSKQLRQAVEPLIFPRKLLERIQVITDRRRYRLFSPEGAEMELAFDAAAFSPRGLDPPRRAPRLHEMEAEILKGPAGALNSLASLLGGTFGFPPSTASKFQVGFERLKMALPSKKTPENLRVVLDDRLDAALQKILADQHRRFLEQLPGVRQDLDTEFVHQARVATRRMRSAVRLFQGAMPEKTASYLAEELKWLGALLGAVRDLDVFLLNLSRFREQIIRFPGRKKKAFENWAERHRRLPLKALVEGLDSRRFRNFEGRFSRLIQKTPPAHPRAPLARKPIREMAPMIITEHLDAVLGKGQEALAKPKLKRFHLLRIESKRLRYALEFLAPAYGGALDPLVSKTVEIQDCLGELQDTVFTRKYIDALYEDWKRKLVDPELVFILGEIYQLQGEIARARREKFEKIWERFSSAENIDLIKGIQGKSPAGEDPAGLSTSEQPP
jgi:triphosphatase